MSPDLIQMIRVSLVMLLTYLLCRLIQKKFPPKPSLPPGTLILLPGDSCTVMGGPSPECDFKVINVSGQLHRLFTNRTPQ